MEIYDYAKYIINNITRATIGNALKISDKIDSTYKFIDLINNICKYIDELILNNRLEKEKCYSIYYIINKYTKLYNSQFSTKKYIINDFIIDLWKIMNSK